MAHCAPKTGPVARMRVSVWVRTRAPFRVRSQKVPISGSGAPKDSGFCVTLLNVDLRE